MKPNDKVGVSLLLLVLATPMMACLIPALAMTAAERDCCKRMAGDCGHKGKAQSHSCCQTITVPEHLAAIKSSSVVNGQHPTMPVAYQVHPGLTIPTDHSPPVSPLVDVSVLRI